ncbi:MAG: hypothetical protein NTY53_22575, partial [Kiritimatiellaeota bacterium]|nr:hypothetical protein [Kiritimatiellota bacterium]
AQIQAHRVGNDERFLDDLVPVHTLFPLFVLRQTTAFLPQARRRQKSSASALRIYQRLSTVELHADAVFD